MRNTVAYQTRLTTQQRDALVLLAQRRKRKVSEIVRDAIDQYLLASPEGQAAAAQMVVDPIAPMIERQAAAIAAAAVEEHDAAERSDRFDRERARILAERQAYWKQQESVRQPGIWQRLRGK
jgi:hypothetical protein